MLISNWKEVLKKAWSIRFAIIASLFAGFEAVFAALEGSVPGVPQGVFSGIAAMLALGGGVARLLVQPEAVTVK